MSDQNEWNGPERRSPDRWHVGKEIPLTVLFALVMQTAGGVWWLSQVSSKIDYAISSLQSFQLNRYTSDDGRRDKELFMTLLEAQRSRMAENERRLAILEDAAKGLKRER